MGNILTPAQPMISPKPVYPNLTTIDSTFAASH